MESYYQAPLNYIYGVGPKKTEHDSNFLNYYEKGLYEKIA